MPDEDLFDTDEVLDLTNEQSDLIRIDSPEEADDPSEREKPSDDEPSDRRGRRRERGQLRQELDEYRRREAEWQRQQQELRDRLARVEGRASAQPEHQQPDRLMEDIRATYEREKEIRAQIVAEGENITPERHQKLWQDAMENDIRRGELLAISANRKAGVRPADPNAEYRAIAMAQYGDIMQHPTAGRYLAALREAELAKGAKDGMDLFNRVAERTRIEFKLGGSRAPTTAARERHSDRRFSPGAAPPAPRAVRMDKEQEQLAEAFYADRTEWSDERKHREYARMRAKHSRTA